MYDHVKQTIYATNTFNYLITLKTAHYGRQELDRIQSGHDSQLTRGGSERRNINLLKFERMKNYAWLRRIESRSKEIKKKSINRSLNV